MERAPTFSEILPARPASGPPTAHGSCFEPDELRDVLARGRFAAPGDGSRALDHFGRQCPVCWRRLAAAARASVAIDLDSAEAEAVRHEELPPVALVLCRLAAHAAGIDRGQRLAPMHRYLLARAGETVFTFWWLVVEEIRNVALSHPGKGSERWRSLEEALAARARDSASLVELMVLTLAYRADERRVTGDPHRAEKLMAEALRKADSSSGVIRATVLEVGADCDRAFGKPHQALTRLDLAERLLQQVDIPGRLADTLTRKGLVCLALGRWKEALVVFDEALREIPPGTDSRLALDVMLHVAAVKVQRRKWREARHFLDEAEPLLSFATRRMRAQYQWLRGLVHLDAMELAAAENHLRQALAGMYRFGPLLARAQILVHLGKVYVLQHDDEALARVAEQLAAVVSSPEIQLYARGKVEAILHQAREVGLELSDPADAAVH